MSDVSAGEREQQEVKNEIEVSVHHIIQEGRPVSKEFEVHTGFNDEYPVSEELRRQVYAKVGLDLEHGDFRSGCPVSVVDEDTQEATNQ